MAGGCFGLRLFTKKSPTRRPKPVTIANRAQPTDRWATLPPDILNVISSLLPVPEQVRIRSVCTAWFAATKDSHPFLKETSPWLMLNHFGNDSGISLVRPYDNRSSFRLPLLKGTTGNVWCAGYKDGWVAALHGLKLVLVNPVTGVQAPFPSLPAQPNVDHSTIPCISKVILSGTPTTTHRRTITAMAVTSTGDLVYANSTDRKWTVISVNEGSSVRDIVYHNGTFVIFCSGPKTWELSADFLGSYRQSQITFLTLDGDTYSSFQYEYRDQLEDGVITLASAPSGELVLVLGVQDAETKKYLKFTVMAFSGMGTFWVPVTDLGDMAVLVDSLQTGIFRVTGESRMRPNCVYLASMAVNNAGELFVDSGEFDLIEGTNVPWFDGGLRIVSSMPFWFVPSVV